MPYASLGKVMSSPICVNIIAYPCVQCVNCFMKYRFCKYTGNVMCTCLYYSFNICNFIISVTLRMFNFLNNGSVYALYFAKHFIQIFSCKVTPRRLQFVTLSITVSSILRNKLFTCLFPNLYIIYLDYLRLKTVY